MTDARLALSVAAMLAGVLLLGYAMYVDFTLLAKPRWFQRSWVLAAVALTLIVAGGLSEAGL